jgi:hypothetical protein
MTFTTTAFDCSSSWLFEVFSCKTTPKDPPSSSAQHALFTLLDTSRPVHLRGGAPRLRPGTSPHALRIPPHGGHPALRELQSGGCRSALAVSDFRLRARLGFSIPFPSSRPTRNYPRLWIQRSSFERRRDLNPPESRAAQRTVRFIPTARSGSACASHSEFVDSELANNVEPSERSWNDPG